MNNRQYTVARGGDFKQMKCASILVGDLVQVMQDQEVPADCILLKSSSKDDGIVYVDTANLDGEVNLKQYRAFGQTHSLSRKKILNDAKGVVECEYPTQDLYSLKANFRNNIDDEKRFPLNAKSSSRLLDVGKTLSYSFTALDMLLRGTRVRNTAYAIGLVVYTGHNTKIQLNSSAPPSKFSQMDVAINRVVLYIFGFKLFCCTFCAAGYSIVGRWNIGSPSYMAGVNDNVDYRAFLVFWSYFSIFSYFIPISLIVSLEVAKLAQAIFMMWDNKFMEDPESGEGLTVRSSNLNDELARTQYIFSDKTGTLTENKMEFDKASIAGRRYDDCRKGQLKKILERGLERPTAEFQAVLEYLTLLAVCNNCVLDVEKDDPTKIKYHAESPDEVALVQFAAQSGVKLIERRKNGDVVVDVMGEQVIYNVMVTLEFSSDRRRSTVFVKTPLGKIIAWSKGADNVMFARTNEAAKPMVKTTLKHVGYFSKTGLRTLAVCRKELSEKQFKKFFDDYERAASSLKDREKLVEEVSDAMEREFDLIGCTAIEDKLQQGVPDTIAYFIKAGIKFWIITGDKQETAIEIGKSCNLVQRGVTVVKINVTNDDECRDTLSEALKIVSNTDRCAVVVDGGSLTFALANFRKELLDVCTRCEAVVCCRTTPLQKALVVRMVKQGLPGSICLSIGDGANDVSMIQEAHIGVGIFGKEGTQAARSADYSIHMFKHLQRLLTVHGRYNLIRSSGLIMYSFYKNAAMFIVQLWFAFFSLFSGQTLYDSVVMALFNVIFTFLPPFFLGVFERDIKEEIIEDNPQVYGEVGKFIFNLRNFSYWIASAFWHSLVIFFSCYFFFYNNDIISNRGQSLGFWDVGTATSSVGIVTVLLHIALTKQWWNVITHIAVWISILAYFVVIAIESQLPASIPNMWKVFDILFSSGGFWFYLPLVPVIALLPNISFLYLKRNYYPSNYHILQERERTMGRWKKFGTNK